MILTSRNINLKIVFVATIVQFYNYALFGLAANILAQNFIPASNDLNKLIKFFAFSSLAVLARPLGAVIFGTLGDYYGRIVSIKVALVLEVLSTVIIATLPSFETSSYLAPILLLLSRILFLMSLSGKVDGIRIYVFERAAKHNKYFANGIVSSCGQIGVLIAASIYSLTTSYEINNLWRLSFIFGGVASVIVLYFSKYLIEAAESNIHQKAKHKDKAARQLDNQDSIVRNAMIFKKYIIIVTIVSGCCGGVYHFLIIFLGTFLAQIAMIISPQESRYLNIAIISTYCIAALISGFIADKYRDIYNRGSSIELTANNAKNLYPFKQILAALFLALTAAIFFGFLGQYNINQYLIYATISCFLIFCTAMFTVPLQVINQGLFRIGNRMRFYSISHSVGSMIFSSTIPFCGTVIWGYTYSISAVISLLVLLLIILISTVLYLQKQILSI